MLAVGECPVCAPQLFSLEHPRANRIELVNMPHIRFNVNDYNIVDLPGDPDANAHLHLQVPYLHAIISTPFTTFSPPANTVRFDVATTPSQRAQRQGECHQPFPHLPHQVPRTLTPHLLARQRSVRWTWPHLP